MRVPENLRNFYRINRSVWPDMPRRTAFVDAFRLTLKVRKYR